MPTFTTTAAKLAHATKLAQAATMFPVIAYSTIAKQEPMRYQLQTQSKSGNWSQVLGCNDIDTILSSAHYHATVRGEVVRVVDMHA